MENMTDEQRKKEIKETYNKIKQLQEEVHNFDLDKGHGLALLGMWEEMKILQNTMEELTQKE